MVSDEQIQAIEVEWDRDFAIAAETPGLTGIEDPAVAVWTLLQAVRERDTQLAQAWGDLREAQQTIAELRKTVDLQPNADVEAIRREATLPQFHDWSDPDITVLLSA